jgi:outer membrane biosynthesis protein TonB
MILGFGRDGAIKYVRITRSAGYEALDAQCRKVFWDIARFPPVPGDFSPTTPEFKFEDSFTFSLNDVQQRSK